MSQIIKTLLVDDHTLVREALAAKLGRSEGVEIVGQAVPAGPQPAVVPQRRGNLLKGQDALQRPQRRPDDAGPGVSPRRSAPAASSR